jgi:CheY-like chemotaxis protein
MATTGNPLRRILVVDDEPLVCDSVRRMLMSYGHEAETAASGQEALALFEKGKFDLIIIDYLMPKMKGDELAAIIKARAPDQPIAMITASAEMLQASGKSLPGVDFIIGKPFQLDDLREAVARILPHDRPSE